VISKNSKVPVESIPLALRFDASADPILYIGEAYPGASESAAAWRIMRINTAVGVSIDWAGGDEEFNNIWADRAILSYS